MAAGNSPKGVVPNKPYPEHIDDPGWALGAWASGFNTLTCGSTVGRLTPDGVVKDLGCPSPFTRVGPAFPGNCDAPVPEFAAHGGNCDDRFQPRPHHGVWAYAAAGDLEDRAGTSMAAPLLAREAAFAFAALQKVCADRTKPYAATVKAFLALTAVHAEYPPGVRPLAKRTVGWGQPSAARLSAPSPDSAVFLWQGLLESAQDIARVYVPVPREWLAQASAPRLRIACAWDTPVNAAVAKRWGCRTVSAQLRHAPGAPAYTGSHNQNNGHPLWLRTYDLRADRLRQRKVRLADDLWILELSYEQVAPYYPAIEFSPLQRVGVAIELRDDEETTGPQAAVQAIPAVHTMTRLSVSAVPIANPVLLKRGR